MDRGTVTPRLYPATESGEEGGKPVFLTRERLAEKRRDMGPYVVGAQMLQDPTADKLQGFRIEWLEYASSPTWRGLNMVLLFDPASRKQPAGTRNLRNDYTSAWAIGLGADRNVYVVDIVRDRLSL